jgi:5-methylcytosine-specific restriction endonuclease McrA
VTRKTVAFRGRFGNSDSLTVWTILCGHEVIPAVEAFWGFLLVGFAITKLVSWHRDGQRLDALRREKNLEKSFLDKSAQEFPELVGAYWNPKRDSVARELRPRILSRTKGKCFYCDKSLINLSEWQVDHVWPHRYGGSEEFINLVPSCKDCNQEKWSYLPPRYLLHKWVVGKSFTSHEVKFLEFYRKNSMANLIGASAHWKGRADYWQATVFTEFVNLVLMNEGIKKSSGKRREELVKRAQSIYDKLDCDLNSSFIYRHGAIQKWLEEDA